MTIRFAAAALMVLAASPAAAHRLDEYLQSTLISVQKDRVQAQMYLTPGVAVFPALLAKIDTDGDGTLSQAEQRAYAERVLGDVSLAVDGERLSLRLVSLEFADPADMKEGRGDIHLELLADLPHDRPKRSLIFENRHETRISAYLINCLVPRDPKIRVTAQKRNYSQSFYQLDFMEGDPVPDLLSANWQGFPKWAGMALLLLVPVVLLRRRCITRRFTIKASPSVANADGRLSSKHLAA